MQSGVFKMERSKNLLIKILLVFLLFNLIFFSFSCQNNSNQDDNSSGVSINMRGKLTIEQYTVATIKLDVVGMDNYEVEWFIDDGTIAEIVTSNSNKVDLKGLNVGSTKITAQIKGTNYNCSNNIIVSKTNEIANIQYKNLSSKTINLYLEGEFEISPYLVFQGNNVDSEFKYSLSDESIVQIDGNKIKALKKGTCSLYVETSFYTQKLNDTVVINVYDNYSFDFNKELISLYKENNKTQMPFSDQIVVNGISVNGEVLSINKNNIGYESQDTSIVTVDSDGKVFAHACGETEILVSYILEGNKSISNKIKVKVNKDKIDYTDEKTYDVDLTSDRLPYELEELFTLEDDMLIKDITDDNIFSINSFDDEKIKVGNRTWEIEGSDTIYTINVCVCTDVIYTAEEFYNFFTQKINKENYIYEGYVILANNIDMSQYGKDYSKFIGSSFSTVGFNGVFDGRNYCVDNLSVKENGLFNEIAIDGIIKNISFKNAKSYYAYGFFAKFFLGSAENVFLDVMLYQYNTNSTCGIAIDGFKSKFSSCVFFVQSSKDNQDSNRLFSYMSCCSLSSVSNTYLISDIVNVVNLSKDKAPSGLNAYNYDQYNNSEIDFSGLDEENWDISNKLPALKGSDNSSGIVEETNINIDKVLYKLDKSKTIIYEVNLFDIISNNVNFTLDKNDLISVKYNSEQIGTISNGIWTVSNTVIKKMESGEQSFSVITSNTNATIINFKLALIDKVIFTATEFYDYFTSKFSNMIENVNDYIVLGADIDMSKGSNGIDYTTLENGYPKFALGNESVGNNSEVAFTGIFDGQGYSVKGLRIGKSGINARGLFRRVSTSGIIRNVSFEDVVTSNSPVIANWVGGTIENVYIDVRLQGYYSTDKIAPVCLQSFSGTTHMTMKNCVIKSSFDKTIPGNNYNTSLMGLMAFVRDYDKYVETENVYLITEIENICCVMDKDGNISETKTKDDMVAYVTTFTTEEVTNGVSFDLDSSVWDTSNGIPKLKK